MSNIWSHVRTNQPLGLELSPHEHGDAALTRGDTSTGTAWREEHFDLWGEELYKASRYHTQDHSTDSTSLGQSCPLQRVSPTPAPSSPFPPLLTCPSSFAQGVLTPPFCSLSPSSFSLQTASTFPADPSCLVPLFHFLTCPLCSSFIRFLFPYSFLCLIHEVYDDTAQREHMKKAKRGEGRGWGVHRAEPQNSSLGGPPSRDRAASLHAEAAISQGWGPPRAETRDPK